MGNDERAFMILLDQGTDAHRNAIQAIVKAHTDEWWHQFADAWVVLGHDMVYWRDLITPVLGLSNASVLVFALPPRRGRGWAGARVAESNVAWLRRPYSLPPEPDPKPP